MIGPWLHKAAVASGNSLSLPPNTTRRKMQMRPARPDGNGVNGAEWMGLNMREEEDEAEAAANNGSAH